jgi:hypothetical protein
MQKRDAATDLTNSQVFDNGTDVGIGNTAPAAKLDVSGRDEPYWNSLSAFIRVL